MLVDAHAGGVTAIALSHNRRFILTGGPQGILSNIMLNYTTTYHLLI
jgi:hypothetical protein